HEAGAYRCFLSADARPAPDRAEVVVERRADPHEKVARRMQQQRQVEIDIWPQLRAGRIAECDSGDRQGTTRNELLVLLPPLEAQRKARIKRDDSAKRDVDADAGTCGYGGDLGVDQAAVGPVAFLVGVRQVEV